MSSIASLGRRIRQDRLASVPRICFCHVPKCAGSALVDAIRGAYSPLDRLLLPNFYLDLPASGRAAEATGESITRLREEVLAYVLAAGRHKYAGGHVPCRPQLVEAFRDTWHFVTVLRDPVERWISGYVYDRYKTESWSKLDSDIEQYLHSDAGILSGRAYLWYFSSMPQDPSIHDYSSYVDEAEENLRRFSLVGTTEMMGALATGFQGIIGRPLRIRAVNRSPNPSGKQEIRSDAALMAQVTEVCRPDIVLYERLKETGVLSSSS